MIKSRRLCGQRLFNLAQALQTGKLRKQQGFEVALAGPGSGLLADATVAAVAVNYATQGATV
jgi:hypothetical protein